MKNNEELSSEYKKRTTFVVSRHTKKTKPLEGSDISGEFYPGITPEGEKIVRERTRNEFLEIVENSEPGTIMIFGGSSDYIRTKSSSRVSGNELKNILKDKKEYMVIDENDIQAMVQNNKAIEKTPDSKTKFSPSVTHVVLKQLEQQALQHPDKKIIIISPLSLKELSMDQKSVGSESKQTEWKRDGDKETWSPYLTEIMKANNNDEFAAVKEWIKNDGKIVMSDGSELKAPSPKNSVEGYLHALGRLHNVAKKLFPDRPFVIQVTGHSWEIDVLVDYLAHNGIISPEGLEDIAKGIGEKPDIISEFESPVITIDKLDKGNITYRGRKYEFDGKLMDK